VSVIMANRDNNQQQTSRRRRTTTRRVGWVTTRSTRGTTTGSPLARSEVEKGSGALALSSPSLWLSSLLPSADGSFSCECACE
jgi:hypothetical protein